MCVIHTTPEASLAEFGKLTICLPHLYTLQPLLKANGVYTNRTLHKAGLSSSSFTDL